MGFRIHRGIFQKLNDARTAYENTFKIDSDGRIKEVDSDGNVTAGYLKVGEQATDADTVDGLHSGSFLRSDAHDSFSGNLTATANDWYIYGLGTRGASAGAYGIGNRNDDSYRQMTFHVPNQAAYSSSGTIPSFGWYSNGSVQLMKLNSDSGNFWLKGSSEFDGRVYADNGVHVRGDWLRVNGSNGIYFESYAGGWHMTDSSWIRAYNSKNIYTGGNIEVGGTIRSNGNGFYVDSTNVINSSGRYIADVDNSTTTSRYFIQSAHGNPRNNLGSPTVTEMALFDSQFRCMTDLSNSYTNLDRVTFWVQQNEGDAWAEVTVSDDQKKRFLRTNNSNVAIPNRAYKYRVEFKAPGYVFANALYFYWSSNSHSTKVHVYKYNASQDTWHSHATSNTNVSSWPGHLYLPFSTIPWHETHTTSTGHHRYIRVEFIPNWSTGSYADRVINLSGGQIWGGYPSGRRTPHRIDHNGNYFFPASLYADNSTSSDDILTTRRWVGEQEYATRGFVTTSLDSLVDSAPGALNTLNELAAALGDDANFSTTVTNSIATKLSLSGGTMTGDINLGTGAASIKKTADTRGNYAAVEVYSSGTGDSDSAIAIQQATSEGDTIIFADYEPHVEWGISAENNSNEIHFTGGGSNNSLGSKTFKNNAGSDRTAYKKMTISLSSGNVVIGGTLSASGYNDSNWNTAYGWGNHADANYLTSVPSEYLTQTEGDARYLQSLPSHNHDSLYHKLDFDAVTSAGRPDNESGTWTKSASTTNWGSYKVGTDADGGRAYNDAPGWIQYNVPSGYHTAYIGQLKWSSGGYFDVHAVKSDGSLVHRGRYLSKQSIEDASHGGDHDGQQIIKISGLDGMTAVRITNLVGRVHLQGIGWTKEIDTDGTQDSTTHWDLINGKPSTFSPSSHTHSYNDLTNLPTIPSNNNQLTNGAGYITSVPSEYLTQTEGDARYRGKTHFTTNNGYSDYYSGGNAGWYRVAEIVLTSNCGGGTLYGTLYDHRYDGADAYQISVVARSECNFTTDNESHYVNIGCTILGSTNYNNYRSKIRAVLVESATNVRRYEIQFYETPWNRDTWQLQTNGNFTVYEVPQAPREAVGTARINYRSTQNADYQRANTAMYAPIYYDSATGGNSTNWNTAYGWGNHASAGYAPSVHSHHYITNNYSAAESGSFHSWDAQESTPDKNPTTDWFTSLRIGHGHPVNYYSNTLAIQMTGGDSGRIYTRTISNGSKGTWKKYWHGGDFTSTNISNWNTAYGWGNHASAGYVTSVTDALGYTPYQEGTALSASTIDGGSKLKVQAGHNDARMVIAYNHGGDSTSEYSGNLVMWTSEPGISYPGSGIGGNVNESGHYYGKRNTNIPYGVALRFNVTSGRAEFQTTASTNNGSFRVGWYMDSNGNTVQQGTITASGYNKSNWDTAYGWGNHSSAGYLTSVPNLAASKITSGTFANARISQSSVTQHQGALSIAASQVSGLPAATPPVEAFVEGGEPSTLSSITFDPGTGSATFTLADGQTFRLAFAR